MERRPNQPPPGPEHLPKPEQVLPVVTITKPDGSQKVMNAEAQEEFDEAFYFATHRPRSKELGS